jgi:hypothetical protein
MFTFSIVCSPSSCTLLLCPFRVWDSGLLSTLYTRSQRVSKHGLQKTKDPLLFEAGQVLVGEGGGVASATYTAADQLVEAIG